MKNINNKYPILVAGLFEVILLVRIIIGFLSKNEFNYKKIILLMVVILIPFIITKICDKKKLKLPDTFQWAMLIFIFLTLYLGEIKKFYDTFWWWDLFIHAIFGVYVVIIGLDLINNIVIANKNVSSNRFIITKIIFSFNFAISLGVLWEVFEFLGDYLFNTSMVKGGLNDTMTDIIAKIVGAFIISLIIYFKEKNKQKN